MSDNTRIWDALGKTDPKQTKKFNRSGGFKGTAIKPIWLALRMTEHFGPCGIGWGPGKPEFQVERSSDEGMVFCTVQLWYKDPASGSTGQVYGVGGDKFVISQSGGLRTSDEAFKAAYTDALGNAMKLIGVAADVHMGLFDDSKYVNKMAEEFDPAEESQERHESAEKKTLVEMVIPKVITAKQAQEFRDACLSTGYSRETIVKALAEKGIKSSAKIPANEFKEWMEWATATAEVPA